MIPRHEIQVQFSRSGGPGGQNVNKTSTKVTVHWPVGASARYTDEQKNRIRTVLRNRINYNDELVLSAESERSQVQNKMAVLERLDTLVAKALVIPKSRRPTRPTRSSKIKRLETKKKHSRAKQARKIFE